MTLTFFPMHLIGLLGMPRRIYTYSPDLGVAGMNLVSTGGPFLIGVSMLIFLPNLWRTRTPGQRAPNDPRGGPRAEGALPSPPPAPNFSVHPPARTRPPP